MRYKLINQKTGQETICDKVAIDGFEYYVNDEQLEKFCIRYVDNTPFFMIYDKGVNHKQLKIICTNNPNIDIPKVVDEVEMMALLQYPYPLDIKDKNDKIIQTKGEKPFNHAKIEKYRRAFVIGYNKSQETHPFTAEDIVNFLQFYENTVKLDFHSTGENHGKSIKELIQLWQEQQPKIVYYN